MPQDMQSSAKEAMIESLIQLTKLGKLHWVGSGYLYKPAGKDYLIPCYFTGIGSRQFDLFLKPSRSSCFALEPVLKMTTYVKEKIRLTRTFWKETLVTRSEIVTIEGSSIEGSSLKNLWTTVEEHRRNILKEALRHPLAKEEEDFYKIADDLKKEAGC